MQIVSKILINESVSLPLTFFCNNLTKSNRIDLVLTVLTLTQPSQKNASGSKNIVLKNPGRTHSVDYKLLKSLYFIQ